MYLNSWWKLNVNKVVYPLKKKKKSHLNSGLHFSDNMSTVNTQDVPACPLSSLPNTAPLCILSPNITHCSLVNELKSLMLSNLPEKPFPPSHFLNLVQESLLSRKFPFSPVLQNGCCYCPFFDLRRNTWEATEPPWGHGLGTRERTSPSSVSPGGIFLMYREPCRCSPLVGKPFSPWYSRVGGPCVTPWSPSMAHAKGPRRGVFYLACWAGETSCSGRLPPAHSARSHRSLLPAAPGCLHSPRSWSRASQGWHLAHGSILCCCAASMSRSCPLPRKHNPSKVKRWSCLKASKKLEKWDRIVWAVWCLVAAGASVNCHLSALLIRI